MSHDWIYHDVWNGRQVVYCRRCGKWDSYLLAGFKPEPPSSPCSGARVKVVA